MHSPGGVIRLHRPRRTPRQGLNTLPQLRALLALLLLIPFAARAQDTPSFPELEKRVGDIFASSCARAGCHAGPVPQMQMDLTRDAFYSSTVDQSSLERTDLKRVEPGNPDSSYLMMKVRGDSGIVGLQMPFGEDALDEEEVEAIAAWIRALDDVGERRDPPPTREAYPFVGWKIVNLPTARALDGGSWLFLIGHRFNPRISSGYESLFGLDGSGIINLSLGYALTDNLFVSLGRSNAADDVELQARYRVMGQRAGAVRPVALAAHSFVNWITEAAPDQDRLRAGAFKFTAQLVATRAFGDRGGLAVAPGILINPDETVDREPPLITVGLGGRWRFHRNLSLVGEWVPIVSGFTPTFTFGNYNRFDSWGGGLEIATPGHVFQIVVSNAVGLSTDHYLRGGDLDVKERDMRLGFNIFRILNF